MAILFAMEGALAQGILWGIMALGAYLTFRLLNVADMTVDGSFALGGAVSATLITLGVSPALTLPISFVAGLIAGFLTGMMNTKLKINVLLASILTQIALYSINIRIMGRANMSLIGEPTLISHLTSLTGGILSVTHASLVIGVCAVTLLIIIIYWFFGTEFGSCIRATGNNEHMVRAVGVNTNMTKIIGLMISNGLVALSGALVAQSQGYADVGMGTGAIVIGLASIIIGEVLLGERFAFWWTLFATVTGSVIYRLIIALVLQMGLKSTDLKLLTALIVAFALSMPVIKERIKRRRNSLPGMNLEDEEDTRHRDQNSREV